MIRIFRVALRDLESGSDPRTRRCSYARDVCPVIHRVSFAHRGKLVLLLLCYLAEGSAESIDFSPRLDEGRGLTGRCRRRKPIRGLVRHR